MKELRARTEEAAQSKQLADKSAPPGSVHLLLVLHTQ